MIQLLPTIGGTTAFLEGHLPHSEVKKHFREHVPDRSFHVHLRYQVTAFVNGCTPTPCFNTTLVECDALDDGAIPFTRVLIDPIKTIEKKQSKSGSPIKRRSRNGE